MYFLGILCSDKVSIHIHNKKQYIPVLRHFVVKLFNFLIWFFQISFINLSMCLITFKNCYGHFLSIQRIYYIRKHHTHSSYISYIMIFLWGFLCFETSNKENIFWIYHSINKKMIDIYLWLYLWYNKQDVIIIGAITCIKSPKWFNNSPNWCALT